MVAVTAACVCPFAYGNHYILCTEQKCEVVEIPDDGPAGVTAVPSAHVQVARLFTTQDGTIQAIELEVIKAGDAALMLAGRRMTVTDLHGNVRAFTLGGSVDGIAKRPTVLILGSAWLDDMTVSDGWGPYADLPMPRYFLPTDGGTLSIEGMDEIAFGALPGDGRHALARDGTAVLAYFNRWGDFDVPYTVVREFYHPAWDHYFMTNRADEVRLLVSGAISGWQATGKALYLYTRDFGQPFFPVCRYLLQRSDSVSHFFSALPDECATVATGAGNILETTSAFYAGLPDAGGSCDAEAKIVFAAGSSWSGKVGAPIYRLWNGQADTNHRYVADPVERAAMIARGWIPEGLGADAVGMCGYSVDAPPLPL